MCLYDVHTDKIIKLKAKVKELEAENHKLKLTMQLHAGDCCSLNNEVEVFRSYWEEEEQENKRLRIQLEKLLEGLE